MSKVSVDIVRLKEVAKACSTRDGILPHDLMNEAATILEETDGEFLSGWEQIEYEANGGRGASAEHVRSLRELAETARVDIMGALAANHVARQAIPLLEQALERQPDREVLARKLRAAYLETGQHPRAAELQKDHALNS